MTDMTFREIISQHLENIRKRIVANIEANGQRASGRTQESIRWEADELGGTLYGRENFHNIEVGTSPQEASQILDITGVIRQWIADKGILTELSTRERESAAVMIGRSILRRGTRLYRSGGRRDVYTNVIDEDKPMLLRDIGEAVNQVIINNININKPI